MAAFRLLGRLVLYYGVIVGLIAAVLTLFPAFGDYLPIGRVQSLIVQAEGAQKLSQALAAENTAQFAHAASLGASLVWLASAVLGALLAALPVSWVYMKIRNPHDYDQSLVDTIVVLPLVVTSIVVVVQHSLALSFSLAGIAGAARFRNTLKSSGDLLFVLLAIGLGLSSGIGALELALVTSAAFNLCFVALWAMEYGERAEMKRYLSDFDPDRHGPSTVTATTTTAAAVVTEVTETFEKKPKADKDDDDD